jgi:hypothetical protein
MNGLVPHPPTFIPINDECGCPILSPLLGKGGKTGHPSLGPVMEFIDGILIADERANRAPPLCPKCAQ